MALMTRFSSSKRGATQLACCSKNLNVFPQDREGQCPAWQCGARVMARAN